MSNKPTRFILLPTRGFTANTEMTTTATANFLMNLVRPGVRALSRGPGAQHMKVLDSIHENGAKLVEMGADAVMALKRAQPGLRIIEETFLKPALAPRPQVFRQAKKAGAPMVSVPVTLEVVMSGDSQPVAGADVYAFTSYATGIGAQGKTNKQGKVKLAFGTKPKVFDRLYVYPSRSAWPILRKNVAASVGIIKVPPIDLTFVDSRVTCYPVRKKTDGHGVKVGVIDTGVGPHRALKVAGGANTVQGELATDFADSDHHGTHVAGIIAARADEFLGISPGVSLRAYRVFGANSDGASNFAIAKAIDLAVSDGCDLLNLSLGGGAEDPLTSDAIKAAREKGVLCIIAAGNDGAAVAWPGRHPLAVCVSAIGIKNTWPSGAVQAGDVTTPTGKLGSFLASFSNRGPEIDIAGPGLGIISTIPGDLYAVMDGTSMACPAVTGAIARRLAGNAAILGMARDAARSDAILKLAFAAARDLGLPAQSQGVGLA